VQEGCSYCWVVLCKNYWFHFQRNLFTSHPIPLGRADAPAPTINGQFRVRCDECGEEHLYVRSNVWKYEQELPASFIPHPLFVIDGERRRSKRWSSEVMLRVLGQSREKGVFEEEVLATSLSEQGAQIGLSANVRVGQTLILKNPRTQKELVSHVVRLERRTGRPQVGVEFLRPAPEFWRLEPRIERESGRTREKVWASVGVECRAWLNKPMGTVHRPQVKPYSIWRAWVTTRTSLFRWLREPMHW